MPEEFPLPEKGAKTGSATDEERELLEIRQTTLEDTSEFDIVSPQETDSSGADTWKSYLDRKKLLDAWTPPQESPYSKFVKTKTINSVEFVGNRIKPRYSGGEIKSERELDSLIDSGEFEKGTAVILDSGGAHSVAMAVKLVEHGFQPIIMLDSIPHTKGINRSEQGLATLLYFAEQMNRLKQEGKIKPDAPPVFTLDTHRDNLDTSSGEGKTKVKNTYTFSEKDFPSSEEFQKLGVQKIVYLSESPNHLGGDLKPIIEKWRQAGIKVAHTGIDPWEQGSSFGTSWFHDDW